MNYLLSEIAHIVGGIHRGADLPAREVATDSRSVFSSSEVVFAAINGKNHDGHNYIARMLTRGVRAFIVEREVELAEGCGMVIVGSATDQAGNPFYKVQNSWGESGPYKGFYYFSRPFVEYKTMDIMVNKNLIPKELQKKMGLK